MKSTKLMIVIMFFMALFIASCSDNKTATPADAREIYVGNWTGKTTGTNTTRAGVVTNVSGNATVLVSKSTDASKIIFNFASSGSKYDAVISGNTFVINSQTVTYVTTGGNATYTILGSGGILNGSLSYNSTVVLNDGSIQRLTTSLNK
jgi:hypothetical protein